MSNVEEVREDLKNFARKVERGEIELSGPGTQAQGR